jgi:hypothetical protein
MAGGILNAKEQIMLDVTLSILALIAGGVTMELFKPASVLVAGPAIDSQPVISEDFQTGNPS